MDKSTYDKLLGFISDERRMRMQHVYQPAIIITLLQNKGRAGIRQIALDFLQYDEFEIERHCRAARIWPKRTLKKHQIIDTQKDEFSLVGFDELDDEQIKELIKACKLRLDNFIKSKSELLKEYRNRSQRPESRKDDKCPFCNISSSRIINQNEFATVIRDMYPVTEMHSLVIPKRHVESYFDLDEEEVDSCNRLLGREKHEIQVSDRLVAGFNVGINDGGAAGQTVHHCHIHLIPRRIGDTDHPDGGVRGVIPDKQSY